MHKGGDVESAGNYRRRGQELQQVKVKVNYQELIRSKKVKCLGVVLDDGLTWKEQVVNVRRKCFAGLAKLRRIRDILPSDTKRKIYNEIVLPLLLCSVASMLIGVVAEDRIDSELWDVALKPT